MKYLYLFPKLKLTGPMVNFRELVLVVAWTKVKLFADWNWEREIFWSLEIIGA